MVGSLDHLKQLSCHYHHIIHSPLDNKKGQLENGKKKLTSGSFLGDRGGFPPFHLWRRTSVPDWCAEAPSVHCQGDDVDPGDGDRGVVDPGDGDYLEHYPDQ